MINKNFSYLWLGSIISQLGDEFYAIALAWWILQKTNSTAMMGLFLFVTVLPGVLLGLITGVITDRYNRKRIIIITNIVCGGLVFIIAYLSMMNMLEVWHVYLIGFGLSVATAFFDPAYKAITPDIVAKEYLVKANGLNGAINGVCTVVGPLLGAFTVSKYGITAVFLVNGISYIIAALLTGFIRWVRSYETSSDKNSFISEIREGLHFINSRINIRIILIIIGIGHFFLGSLSVALPFIANKLKGDGVSNLGMLQMLLGVGFILGSILVGSKKKISFLMSTLNRLLIGIGVCFVMISVLQHYKIQFIAWYLPFLVVIGILISSASVYWQSMLQLNTPSHMTGRVFSVSTLIGNTTLPIAYGIFGLLLEISSISVVMIGCGNCLLLFSAILFVRTEMRTKSGDEIPRA